MLAMPRVFRNLPLFRLTIPAIIAILRVEGYGETGGATPGVNLGP